MKFFSKYKKQIFSVFLCVALFSCFTVFSISSSADSVVITPIVPDTVGLVAPGWVVHPFTFSNGIYDFDTYLEDVPTDSPYFYFLTFHYNNLGYVVPQVDGRGVSLSFEISLDIDEFGYLSSDPADIINSAIFTSFNANVYFVDGTSVSLARSAFTLFDTDSGQVVDPYDVSFWMSHINSPFSLKLSGTLNLSAYMGKEISSIRIYFPNGSGSSRIYYRDDFNYIAFSNLNTFISFVYTPTLDIVDNGFSGVNNRLDSLNSTMNTIDQDVNRVNQKLDQTNETLGDINQGIQDILNPSAPAVDFKNQWNDYFENNPIPDLSELPFYDMSNMMTLLADSSSIIRNIFSPFFLRDYSVTIPLTQGFANVRLDPVATYVSLSIGLSLAVVIISLLKGSRG